MPKNWYLQTEVLEKTPEIALDSKEFKPSIVREINPEYSLEGFMLKLKLNLMKTADSLDKSLMMGRLRAEGGEGIKG